MNNLKQFTYDTYHQNFMNFKKNIRKIDPALNTQTFREMGKTKFFKLKKIQLDYLFNQYLKIASLKLQNFMKVKITDEITADRQLQTLSFILYLIVIFFFFFLYWIPQSQKMNSEVMISLINFAFFKYRLIQLLECLI